MNGIADTQHAPHDARHAPRNTQHATHTANDLDSRSNSPNGKGCGASELNTHADAVPFDGFYSCNCSAGQSGNNCQNESPNADQSAAKQKKNGGKTAGLVILVLILIPAVAFGLLKLKVYIATRPFDFTEEIARLVDADRINPEKSRVPYEVSRSRLTMFCRIGDGAYSDIWKGAFASGEESEVSRIYLYFFKNLGCNARGAMRGLTPLFKTKDAAP